MCLSSRPIMSTSIVTGMLFRSLKDSVSSLSVYPSSVGSWFLHQNVFPSNMQSSTTDDWPLLSPKAYLCIMIILQKLRRFLEKQSLSKLCFYIVSGHTVVCTYFNKNRAIAIGTHIASLDN